MSHCLNLSYQLKKNNLYPTFSERDISIMNGEICPYCGAIPELIDSAEIYNGTSYGLMYICRPCNAYVSCHRGTQTPKGRLANEELRQLKIQAHLVFDIIWREKYKRGRHQAYYWLSKQLNRPFDFTHIGMMDEETCRRTIEVCEQYLMWKNPNRLLQFKSTIENNNISSQ